MRYIIEMVTGEVVRPEGGYLPQGCMVIEAPLVVERRLSAGVVYHYLSGAWMISPVGTAYLLAENWRRVRIRRDALLVCTDFTQLPDVTLDHAAWAVYRQALRDVTNQPDPTAITWPTPPDASIIKNVPPMEVLL
jgi:hypothetical protein